MSQELKARISTAKVAYLKTERLLTTLVGSLFVCRAKGLLEKRFGVVVPWGSTKLVLGFVLSPS